MIKAYKLTVFYTTNGDLSGLSGHLTELFSKPKGR